jgi:Starch-binding associating with outer membrane
MKKILVLIVIIATINASCKKYLDDAYKNPNLPTYSQPESVLQSCISSMHRGIAFDARATGFYTRNFSSLSGFYAPERHGYVPGSDAYGDMWRTHYWNMGYNIIDMIDSGKVSGKLDYVAAAYALNAWSWVTTADYHGELPVIQAFEKGRLRFDYDDQKVAYDYAMRYCDSSLKYWGLAAGMSAPTLAIGDQYFFNGDQNKWRKFVNGMKARIYHRYQKKSTYLTKEVDSVIKYAALAMQNTNDDASVKFNLALAPIESRNFFGPVRNNIGLFRMSKFMNDLMVGTPAVPGQAFNHIVNDPRIRYIHRPSPDGIYRGIATYTYADLPNAPVDQRVPSLWGRIAETAAPGLGVDTGARTFFRNDAPSMMMTYSEMQFLLAEAYYLKGQTANAYTAYLNGINGHFDMLNTHYFGYLNTLGTNSPATMTKVTISAADRAAYLANTAFCPGAVNLTLKYIMCQKYIALWGWGFVENWVDMRRYNYDDVNIYPGFVGGTSTQLYPDNGGKLAERVRPRFNSENLWNVDPLNAIGGFNQDYHTKKCWFSIP